MKKIFATSLFLLGSLTASGATVDLKDDCSRAANVSRTEDRAFRQFKEELEKILLHPIKERGDKDGAPTPLAFTRTDELWKKLKEERRTQEFLSVCKTFFSFKTQPSSLWDILTLSRLSNPSSLIMRWKEAGISSLPVNHLRGIKLIEKIPLADQHKFVNALATELLRSTDPYSRLEEIIQQNNAIKDKAIELEQS